MKAAFLNSIVVCVVLIATGAAHGQQPAPAAAPVNPPVLGASSPWWKRTLAALTDNPMNRVLAGAAGGAAGSLTLGPAGVSLGVFAGPFALQWVSERLLGVRNPAPPTVAPAEANRR